MHLVSQQILELLSVINIKLSIVSENKNDENEKQLINKKTLNVIIF